jgi:hypothetical protein
MGARWPSCCPCGADDQSSSQGQQLVANYRRWQRTPIVSMSTVAPSLAFAVIGQARAAGALTPEAEARLLTELLNIWAFRSTLDISALCAEQQPIPLLQQVS